MYTHHVFTSFKTEIQTQSHIVDKHAHVQSIYTDKQTYKYTNTVKYLIHRLFLQEVRVKKYIHTVDIMLNIYVYTLLCKTFTLQVLLYR